MSGVEGSPCRSSCLQETSDGEETTSDGTHGGDVVVVGGTSRAGSGRAGSRLSRASTAGDSAGSRCDLRGTRASSSGGLRCKAAEDRGGVALDGRGDG